jgi:hypothetical protein
MELTNFQMLGVAVAGCVIAAVMGSFAGRVEATMADPNATMSAGCVSAEEYATMASMSAGNQIMGVTICEGEPQQVYGD